GPTRVRDRMASRDDAELNTTIRGCDCVHDDTAHVRSLVRPAKKTSHCHEDLVLCSDYKFNERQRANPLDIADLAGGHEQLRVGPFLRDQLHGGAGRTGDLRAAAGAELDRVHHGAQRDVAQGQVVAGLDVSTGTVLDPVALTQLGRREDVTLLAVQVVQQRDACGAVGVVLDVSDLRLDAVLVVTAEVDHAVGTLVATAPVTGGDTTVVVAAA